jgi:carotenoid cleavage dioxygenase-like enzyme
MALYQDQGTQEHGLCSLNYAEKLPGWSTSVKGVQRTVSNTNVVPHNGMLLAMKEDGPPYAMDPHTLQTKQLWDWQG